jgi:hypothetical protein
LRLLGQLGESEKMSLHSLLSMIKRILWKDS